MDAPILLPSPTLAESEAFLAVVLGADWIDKPLKRFAGRSFRQTFKTDPAVAVELLHQIAHGFVF
jgi:hypothetical protein